MATFVVVNTHYDGTITIYGYFKVREDAESLAEKLDENDGSDSMVSVVCHPSLIGLGGMRPRFRRHRHEWSAWKLAFRPSVSTRPSGVTVHSEVMSNVRHCILPKCGITQERKAKR